MQPIPKDYVPPENEYGTFSDGEYKVKGFQWFSLDDQHKPMLVVQKDGQLKGRLRFTLENGDDGPPMSVGLNEMSLLGRAFGIENLPSIPSETQAGQVSQYMAQIVQLSNEKNKILKVKVTGGWANQVQGMEVPPGLFYFHLVDIFPNVNGEPTPKDGQFGKYFFVAFEVDAGEGGSETPYKGARFVEIVTYAVTVNEGQADWQRTQKGAWTASALRLSNLMRISAPSIMSGEFNPSNPNNILPYWKKNLEPHTMKGQRIKDEKQQVHLLWQTIEEVEGFRGQQKQVPENLSEDLKAKKIFAQIINTLVGGVGVVESDEGFTLTPQGKPIVAKYVVSLRESGKIPSSVKSINDLAYDHIGLILKELNEPSIQDLKNEFYLLGIGLEEKKEGDEFGDTPF